MPVPSHAPATLRRTACNRDCPDACSLLVTVEDGRATALRGDPDDPVTRGFLCERTGRFLARQYAPDRLTTPLVRRGGALVPVGWDEALALAADRLLAARREHGPGSILHYRSGGSLGILKLVVDHFFERFGPVAVKRGDICSGAGEAAQELDFGVSESHDLHDLLDARTIVLWGRNPHVSGVHLLPVLREAMRRGATLVGVDPVRTKAAGLCHLFVQPRPGADADLAFGVARRLFDLDLVDARWLARCDHLDAYRALVHAHDVAGWARRADVDAADVERIAALYGEERPAALLVGWGLARRSNGAATVRALDALGAISGNLGVPGGGVSYYFGRRTSFDLGFVRGTRAAPRTFSETRLGEELLAADPPVRCAWITAGNPVSMLPDSGAVRAALERVPFVVVVDTHPTDTTDVADLVLPTLTLLEDSDVLGAYGNHWLRVSEPAIAPPAGPRHELEIVRDLATRVGLGEAFAGSPDDWKRRVTRTLASRGAGLEALRKGPVRRPDAARVLFADGVVPTANGRVQLLARAPAEAARPTPERPLLLLAVSTPRAQSSQWSVAAEGPPEVRVHPSAAQGLADGAPATLESALGALDVVVRHDERVRPDVALMEKGGMLRQGRCANLLVRAAETDAGGGGALYDEPVRLLARVTSPGTSASARR